MLSTQPDIGKISASYFERGRICSVGTQLANFLDTAEGEFAVSCCNCRFVYVRYRANFLKQDYDARFNGRGAISQPLSRFVNLRLGLSQLVFQEEVRGWS